MKRLFLAITFVALATGTLNAQQEWFDKYKKLLNDGDTIALKDCICRWEKAEPNSPDVIAAWYNYYVKRAMEEVLSLSTVKPADGEQYLELQNDTTKETAGYLYGQTEYNDKLMQAAYAKIDEGIRKYPDRIDLPFGKVHMLLKQGLYDDALSQLSKVIERSKTNRNQWLWTLNKPFADGKEFLIDTMQDYFNQLLDINDNKPAYELNEMVLAAYPEDIRFRSNKASLLAMKGNYAEALPLFASIHKDAPEDDIVAFNLAICYEKTGDKKNAIANYQPLANSKNADIATAARQALRSLKGK